MEALTRFGTGTGIDLWGALKRRHVQAYSYSPQKENTGVTPSFSGAPHEQSHNQHNFPVNTKSQRHLTRRADWDSWPKGKATSKILAQIICTEIIIWPLAAHPGDANSNSISISTPDALCPSSTAVGKLGPGDQLAKNNVSHVIIFCRPAGGRGQRVS